MGLETRACCDVFKTYNDVALYEITIRHLDIKTGTPLGTHAIKPLKAYLGPRACKRLGAFIHRGVTCPGTTDDESKEASDVGTQPTT